MGIIAYAFGGIGLFLLLDGALLHTGSMRADSKYAFAAGVRGMIWRIQSSNHFICWIFSGK